MALRGRLDGVFEGVLRGWAWNPASPEQRQELDILVDGAPLARRRADRPRADLGQAGFGDGAFGFEWPLPIAFQDGASHSIAIHLADRYPPLTLDSLEVVVPRRLHMLRGAVERVTRGQLTGWVWDQARANAHLPVEMLLEGVVVARAVADRPRPDLVRARIGQGNHGFAFDLAGLGRGWRLGARVEIRVRAEAGEWVVGGLELPEPSFQPTAPARATPLPARAFLDTARELEARREFPAAARALDSGLALHPADFDLVSVRARIHFAQQELEAAERLAQQALSLRPGHPRPITLLARITSASGRHAEAADFWARIPPGDAAYRERLAKRPRDLAKLGRRAEAVSEMTAALRLRPDDFDTLRLLAEASEAAGALHTALAHWRRLATEGRDPVLAGRRAAALEERLAPPAPDPLPSPLRNPTLRDWSGPLLLAQATGTAQPAAGLLLRGALRASPVSAWERRPGELPGYSLWLEAAGAGAEALFLLDGAQRAELARGLRMGLEIEALAGSAPPRFTLALAATGEGPGRILLAREAEARPRLLRFDLRLDSTELALLDAGTLALAFRLEGAGTITLQPPRPLARLPADAAPPAPPGFESEGLAAWFSPASPAPAQRPLATPERPFTTVELAGAAAQPAIIRAALAGTGLPLECVATPHPAWPADLRAELEALAARDRRFRLLPGAASPADGWVAELHALPPGEDWLAALHDATRRGERLDGATLTWRAPAG